MEGLARHFKKHLPKWQQKIEAKVGITLGEIDVKPFPEFKDEWPRSLKELPRPLRFLGNTFLRLCEGTVYAAMAGKSTIYYDRSILGRIIASEMGDDTTLIHELAHITHSRLIGAYIGRTKLPLNFKEGVANYITREIFKDEGLAGWFNYICPEGYAEAAKFRSELESKGIYEFKDAIKFISQFRENEWGKREKKS